MPKYDLDGQVAIVSGGGRGIGQAIALRLAREGVSVAAADLNEGNVRAVADEINASGGQALALKVDVTRKDEVEGMVRSTVERFKQVNILVNHAGIGAVGPLLGT